MKARYFLKSSNLTIKSKFLTLLTLLVVGIFLLGTLPHLALAANPPTASFDYSPSTPNPDDSISLDASGSSDNGTIVSYEWDTDGDGNYGDYDDVGDGETSSVIFGTGGTYTVGLKITDDSGNTDTVTKQITVDNPSPTASYSFSPSTPNPDDSISLDASGSSDSDGSITEYEWDTDGDGNYGDYDDVSDGQTASVSFDTGGTYTVGLRVTDNGEKSSTTTKQITVENPAPTASFSHSPSTPNPDDSISLDASDSSDSDGRITEYEWDTDGDGNYGDYDDVSDGQTATTSFDTGGTYTVGLRVTDNGDKSETTTTQITVENPEPTAVFSYSPSTPNPDDSISLDASGSSDSDGSITEYEWDTDGDGTYGDYDDVSDGQSATTSFDTAGTYTVGLQVTDNGEKSHTVTKQITVENPAPTASFSYSPATPNPDDSISLDASGSSDSDGSIADYEWDTDGDGTYGDYDDVSDGQSATTSFDTAGTYTVGLQVTDNGAKSTTVTKQITVENPPPTANFTHDISQSDGLAVSLDGSASSDADGQVIDYDWYVSGDRVASGQSANVQFRQKGTYDIRLVVTDNGESQASTTKSVGVSASPVAELSAPDRPLAAGTQVDLSAAASSDPDGEIQSYRWEFSDGTTSRGQTATKAFTQRGQYSVTLTVTDDTGNSVSTGTTIEVKEPPEVTVSTSPSEPIDEEPVQFEAASNSVITDWKWDFNSDGEVDATGQDVEHAFSEGGEKQVTLTVIDSSGLAADVEKTVSVRSVDPNANFSWSPTVPRDTQDVVFVANSSDEITDYEWDFNNDGEVDATGKTVTHRFEENGKQPTVLTITDEYGDTASYSEVVTVQRSVAYELVSERSTVEPGAQTLITLSVSNNLPDEEIQAKLNLDLPDSGVAISGVDGTNLASSSSTEFLTVGPGQEDTIQIRAQVNSAGAYNISGNTIYYVGGQDSSDRRTTTVGPIEIDATASTLSADGPGFSVITSILALVSLSFFIAVRN